MGTFLFSLLVASLQSKLPSIENKLLRFRSAFMRAWCNPSGAFLPDREWSRSDIYFGIEVVNTAHLQLMHLLCHYEKGHMF